MTEHTRNFDDFISAYVRTFTPKGEAPERFHFWTAVSTVAGALRRRVYLDAGTFRWYPNFYIVLVGPPGLVKKSTVINIGARMLREVPNVHVGADCTTWQNFVVDVSEAKDYFAEGTPSADLMEQMLSQSYTVTSAITMQISEFGTFLDPTDKMMVSVLTELYDCKVDQSWLKKTKTQGEDNIMNPFVNLIAGTTPDWINDNFTRQFGGWGLSSRCIFIHAAAPERRIASPGKLWAGKFADTMKLFIEDLIHINELQGAYELEPDAEEFWEDWYKAHGERHAAMEAHPHKDPWLCYYLARKTDQVMKLALVLAASQWDTPRIALHHIREAVRRADEIETEISRIFRGKFTLDNRTRLRHDVWNGLCANLIRAGGEVEEWRVHNYCRAYMSGGEEDQFLKQLLLAQQLSRRQAGTETVFTFGNNAELDDAALAVVLGEATVRKFREDWNLAATGASSAFPLPQLDQEAQAAPPPEQPSDLSLPLPQQRSSEPAARIPQEPDPSLPYQEQWQPPVGLPEEPPED